MYRLWGKIITNNDIKDDYVFELEASELSKAEKLKKGIEALCYHFDLTRPMWFSDNESGIKQIGKTRFIDHHFIEPINFDYLEIEILEDDH